LGTNAQRAIGTFARLATAYVMNEASFSGFFRAVLTIIVAWVVIRILIRLYLLWQASQRARGTFHQATPDPRAKGEVRIEPAYRAGGPLDKNDGSPRQTGPIEDADYEEVK